MPPLISFLFQSSFRRAHRQTITVPITAVRRLNHGRDQSQTTAAATERQKRPSRGGQNLSDRYRRLERSVRGKDALLKALDIPGPSASISSGYPPRQAYAKTFRGFRIPEEPKEPAADECCMSGCAICVHDLYQDSLAAYNESIASLRTSLLAMHIPESEWPSSIRTSPAGVGLGQNISVSLSAFQELERAIKEKQKEQNGQGDNTGS